MRKPATPLRTSVSLQYFMGSTTFWHEASLWPSSHTFLATSACVHDATASENCNVQHMHLTEKSAAALHGGQGGQRAYMQQVEYLRGSPLKASSAPGAVHLSGCNLSASFRSAQDSTCSVPKAHCSCKREPFHDAQPQVVAYPGKYLEWQAAAKGVRPMHDYLQGQAPSNDMPIQANISTPKLRGFQAEGSHSKALSTHMLA